MTKAELISHVAEEAKLNESQAERAVNAFISGVKKGVADDGLVKLQLFGTFRKHIRKGKTVKFQLGGQEMQQKTIPERQIIAFKVSKKVQM